MELVAWGVEVERVKRSRTSWCLYKVVKYLNYRGEHGKVSLCLCDTDVLGTRYEDCHFVLFTFADFSLTEIDLPAISCSTLRR